jgi:ATP-dependent Clp protease protease subunit
MFKSEFEKFAIKDRGIGSHTLDGYQKYLQSSTGIYGMTPNIVEEREMRVSILDVFSRLMRERILFLGTGINSEVANIIVAQLLFLDSVDGKSDIRMYINSGGGEIYAGNSVLDTMNYISPDVATTCTGLSASMAAVLLCAGAKGKRSALKHSRIMIHQPLGGAQGQASDIEITAREIGKLKKELYEVISINTGKDIKQVESDCDRDYWMIASEAKDYGLIDEVLVKKV